MTGRTAVAEEWQSGGGSLARQASHAQGNSRFPFPSALESGTLTTAMVDPEVILMK